MNPNDISGISIQDDLDEFDFSAVSLAEMDSSQIAEKIKKLEANSEKIQKLQVELAKKMESKCCSDLFGGTSMLQIGWQFGKMEKELGEMKVAKDEEKRAIEEVKKEVVKLSQENVEMFEKVEKLTEENGKLKEELVEMGKGIAELKVEIGELKAPKEEGDKKKLSQELRQMQGKQTAHNETIANLSEPIAAGLEARNKSDIIEIRENKLNLANCERKMMVAKYDYDRLRLSPNADAKQVELSFRINDIITVYGPMDNDGFYLGELNGVRGLVPSNFIMPASQTPDTLSACQSTPRPMVPMGCFSKFDNDSKNIDTRRRGEPAARI